MEIKVILMSNFACKLLCKGAKGLQLHGGLRNVDYKNKNTITDSNKSVS